MLGILNNSKTLPQEKAFTTIDQSKPFECSVFRSPLLFFNFPFHITFLFRKPNFVSFQALIGENGSGSGQPSTWKNFWKKIRILMPYLWPKKSAWLQLRVIVCVILLIGVRVANVFVPLLSKEIGRFDPNTRLQWGSEWALK